ncbi:MAG: Glu/Leu/Phe/Val dehydrogenase dimerization domain-containing protein [candidate division WOR-3 bacterium]|jgi:leucine dehydrogenase
MSKIVELDIFGWEKVYIKEIYGNFIAFIAIHSTKRGPALGGCRFYHYENHRAKSALALEDVLRLSRGMTYKATAGNLPLGGGKAVIISEFYDLKPDIRRSLFESFGDFVEELEGKYITAEDVGTLVEDMKIVSERTKHVVGLPESMGGLGDPSPVTAIGVFTAINYITEKLLNKSPSNTTILLQGLGKVGSNLLEHLYNEGYKIYISDVSPKAIENALNKYKNLKYVPPDEVFDIECDIFSPNALGKVINRHNVEKIKHKAIVGAANNQIENYEVAQRLQDRGIIYAPDYAINLGGLTLVYYEYELKIGKQKDKESARNIAIEKTKENVLKNLEEIFEIVRRTNKSPAIVADEIVEERMK